MAQGSRRPAAAPPQPPGQGRPPVTVAPPRTLTAETPSISAGALVDEEIQRNPQAFGLGTAVAGTEPGAPSTASPNVINNDVDPLAPALNNTFDAINFNEDANLNGFFQIPPDPSGAAGPNHVVNVVNSAIEWYTKSGTRQNRQTLTSFFAAAPNPPQTLTFDPKVIYDQYENRFVVTTMERIEASGPTPNQSRVYFAVSDDNDPNGVWRFFTLTTEEVINGRQTWADFPGLSVDADAIYYTNNQFAHNNQTQAGVFQGQRLRIIAKQPYYVGGAAIFNSYDPAALASANPAGDGFALSTTMQPTQMYGDLPGGLGTFLIAYSGINDFVSGSDANLFVQIIQVDNPLTGPVFTGYFSKWGTIQQNDNLFSGLPGAPQNLTTRRIATNDRRFSQNGVYRNGQLYCAAPVLLPSSSPESGQVTVHWFNINPAVVLAGGTASDPPPTDQGNIGGETIAPGTYTFFPSVAVDLAGNLGVGFAASAPSIFPGSYYTGRLAADPPGTTQPPSVLRAGQDRYIRDFTTSMTVTSRWGDYTGIWLDPSNETTMWVYNEHALPRGTVLGGLPEEDGRWGTAWGSFSLTAPATPTVVPLIISEFRARGPNGDFDEFIEIYNTTNSTQNVIAVDGSAGYSVAAQDGVVRCIIPNGTMIPGRGHFLCVNGVGYSLDGYATRNAGYAADIGDAQGVALFPTSNPANFTAGNRLDAFGYTSSPALYREGGGYPFVLTSNVEQSIYRDLNGGPPKDTNDNGADFIAVNAQPNVVNYGIVLGAPGPENLASPIQRNSQFGITLLDPTESSTEPPNRERQSAVVPNGAFGTLIIRRTFTNNTGQPVTRLRIRVVDITTLNTPAAPVAGQPAPCGAPPCADLRVSSSPDEAAIGTGMGPVSTRGTVLEIPPQQPVGGGYNSSLLVNNVTLATPMASGSSININFRMGVQQRGSFRFFINVEALP